MIVASSPSSGKLIFTSHIVQILDKAGRAPNRCQDMMALDFDEILGVRLLVASLLDFCDRDGIVQRWCKMNGLAYLHSKTALNFDFRTNTMFLQISTKTPTVPELSPVELPTVVYQVLLGLGIHQDGAGLLRVAHEFLNDEFLGLVSKLWILNGNCDPRNEGIVNMSGPVRCLEFGTVSGRRARKEPACSLTRKSTP